jgi:hypothetical protein
MSCTNCGAEDWANLTQRMHYIAHLFRAMQERVELLGHPFAADVVTAFRSGRLPDGQL